MEQTTLGVIFGGASCLMIGYRILDGMATKKETKERHDEQKLVTDQMAAELAEHRDSETETLQAIAMDIAAVATQTRLTNVTVDVLKETTEDHEDRIRVIEKVKPKRVAKKR